MNVPAAIARVPGVQERNALHWLAGAGVASWVFRLVIDVHQLRLPIGEAGWAGFGQSGGSIPVQSMVHFALSLFYVVVLVWLARCQFSKLTRVGFALSAILGFGNVAFGLMQILAMLEVISWQSLSSGAVLWSFWIISLLMPVVLALACYFASGRSRKIIGYAVGYTIVVLGGLWFNHVFPFPFHPYEEPYKAFALRNGLSAIVVASGAMLILRCAAAISVDSSLGESWTRAVGGLRLYRSALLMRIWVGVVGGALLLLLALSRSAKGMLPVYSLVAFLAMISVVMAAIGTVRFTRLPITARGRICAQVAAIVTVIAACCELYSLRYIAKLLTGDPYAIGNVAELQILGGFSELLAVAGVVLLVIGFFRIGRYLRSDGLPTLAIGSLIAILLTALGRNWIFSKTMVGGGLRKDNFAFIIVILIGAIVSLFIYLRTVKTTIEVMEQADTTGTVFD